MHIAIDYICYLESHSWPAHIFKFCQTHYIESLLGFFLDQTKTMPPQKGKQRRERSIHLLRDVANAITSLKDAQGSTVRNIVRHINCNSNNKRLRKTSITMEVRHALKRGLQKGMFVHRAGKYKMALVPNRNKDVDLVDSSSRQKKQERGRRPVKQLKSLSNVSNAVAEDVNSGDDEEVVEMSRGRRPRRRQNRRRKSRRRRSHGRRRANHEDLLGDEKGYYGLDDGFGSKRSRPHRSRSVLSTSRFCNFRFSQLSI